MIHLQYKLQSLSLLLSVNFLDFCILMISSLIFFGFLSIFFGFLPDNEKLRYICNTNYKLSLLLSVSFLDFCILMISSLICLRFLYNFFGFLSDNGKLRSICNTNYNLSLSLLLSVRKSFVHFSWSLE